MSVTTFYPDPSPESSSVDGHSESEKSTWNAAHDATTGDVGVDDNTSLVARATGGGGSVRSIVRAAILFDTSALPDTDVISSANIQCYAISKIDTENDANSYLTIVTSNLASNTAVGTADYDAIGDAIDNPTKQSDDVDLTDITTSSYNTWTLNATGRGNISKTGISKFGMREGHDIVDDPIGGENQIVMASADTADTTSDPKLVVTHAAPAVKDKMFLMF